MSAIPAMLANPYRGPIAFRRGDRLYGRRREARELLHLLVAERIVLLHSPSGAGKTSLIQAALVPALEQRDFAVRPVIRVSRAAPLAGANRYLQSVLSCLEEQQGSPALPPEQLAARSLDTYLAQRPIAPEQNGEVLIFDQFEEILTLDPTDEPAKLAFFEQLGAALARRNRWALFAMREDYVAALAPWLWPVPTRLATTYRIGLLGIQAAQQAMRGPAADQGVEFEVEAAAALCEDLARVMVQRPDGRPEARVGTTVEPVQLQVVCRRLWDQRFGPQEPHAGSGDGLLAAEQAPPPAEHPRITLDDVRALGTVDRALADYYAEGVLRAAAASGVSERQIRTWFDRRLITAQQIRGQVQRGEGASEGLPNEAVQALVDAYLVRQDERRGSVWYELAHDRLIQPVRESNLTWFAANLNALQRTAELWDAEGRPDSLLFRAADLDAAEQWAAGGVSLTPAEQAFLEASREERRRQEEERARVARELRQAGLIRRLGSAALAAAVIAIAGLGIALLQWNAAARSERAAQASAAEARTQEARAETSAAEARTQQSLAETSAAEARTQQSLAESSSRVANARQLVTVAIDRIAVDPELVVLLGLAAVESLQPGDAPVPETTDILQQAAQAARVRRTITLTDTTPFAVALSPDGNRAAFVGGDTSLRFVRDATAAPSVISPGGISTLALSPDGATIAAAGLDGSVSLWSAADMAPIRSTAVFTVAATSLAFSPDGSTLAAGSVASELLLLDTDSLQPRLRLRLDAPTVVYALSFSRDGRRLAALNLQTRRVFVWNTANGALVRTLDNFAGLAIALTPDGSRLLTGGFDGTLNLWDLNIPGPPDTPPPSVQLRGHTDSIQHLLFNPNGTLLASAGSDGQIRLWDLLREETVLILAGHSGQVRNLSFRADGQALLSSSDDSTLRLWSLDLWQPAPGTALAYSPDGSILATGGAELWLWDTTSGALIRRIGEEPVELRQAAFSADGTLIATAGDDGAARVYEVASGALRVTVRHEDTRLAGVALSPDGRLMATAANDATARIWELASGQEYAPPVQHEEPVRAVAFSPDSATLASAGARGIIRLWSAATRDEAAPPITWEGEEITRLSFSPEGARLGVGATGDSARIYELADPSRFVELRGHGGNVNDLAFSPDGTRVATASTDGTLRLWDATSGAELARFGAARDNSVVAFDPTGSTLAATGEDGVVRIIPLEAEALLAFARSRVSRTLLSVDECAVYYLSGPEICAAE